MIGGRVCPMNCDNCGRDFTPYLPGQRFCSRRCSDEWFQEERRQAVEWFRAMGMTVQTKRGGEEQRTR
jgi:predicted nucleic acid-binding Zn ribbon protein